MSALSLTMVSPFPLYLDEAEGADSLAPRPTTIEGKVIGLLPNWRPSAFDLLKAVGALLEERYHPREIVMAQPLREVPVRKGKLLDGMSAQLDDLARRVDVVVTATGDWGSCTTWCSHVTPAMEKRGIPTVMITTNTFTQFGRRMASTQGCPYVVIAETPNPIRGLGAEELRARVEAMLPTIIDGFTLPPLEIVRRIKDIAHQQIHPAGVVRSSVPV